MVEVRRLVGCGMGALAACASEADPRPQVVLFVDTDAPVVGQLADHQEISPDAAIDTLWLEIVSEGKSGPGAPGFHEFVVSDPASWPVSFGVAPPPGGGVRHLRLRAFRGQRAQLDICDGPTPPISITIDRLVDVAVPSHGVVQARVFLASDCRAVPNALLEGTTCIDADRKSEPADAGVETLDAGGAGAAHVGTWSGAMEQACSGTPTTTDSICVPGGFTILGDERVAFDEISDLALISSCPPLPVIVSPFWMDRTEFTVGRFNDLVKAGKIAGVDLPSPSGSCECTWLGTADHTNDDLPLNCVSYDTALKTCMSVGGRLPTQAQWEHAARGRGRGWTFPWGDETPACSQASIFPPGPCPACPGLDGGSCGDGTIEPAGSHLAGSSTCRAKGDVSRDGILDLAGSLSEATLDRLLPYNDQCWSAGPMRGGVAIDPVCNSQDAGFAAHGGNWALGFIFAAGAAREPWAIPPLDGFRCVYPEAP